MNASETQSASDAKQPKAAPRITAAQILLKIKRRAIVTTAFFALLFSALAVAQWLFVRHQLYSVAWAEALDSASRIAGEIADTNGLDMSAIKNAFFPVREWYIVAASGTIIDLEGVAPNLIGRVTLPTNAILNDPQTYVSEFGDKWRMLAKRLNDGGTLVLGSADSDLIDLDAKLLTNAARFGTTLQEARLVNPKRIDWAIDYAILDREGNLVAGLGSVPLRSEPDVLAKHIVKREIILAGKPFLLAHQIVYDSAHRPLATIVVPRGISAERRALQSQWHFDAVVAILACVVVVFIMLGYFIVDELRRQRIHPSLTQARKQGEGQYIEFKRSLLWDSERRYEDENLRSKVLKAIVGFLNSGGGSLFIGVRDDGQPWGIAEDLKRCEGSEDKFHQRLRNFIANSIGAEFSPYIMTRIDDDPDYSGYRVFFVVVNGARQAAFMKSGSHSFFYVRSGPETLELDMQKAYRHILESGLKI